MEIIPAIDIRKGNVVRLHKGRYEDQTIFSFNPLEIALNWENFGAQKLHIVDLDGALSGNIDNLKVIKEITNNTNLSIQVGGGIRDFSSANNLLNKIGIHRIIYGTTAVEKPNEIKKAIDQFGNDKIIVSLDSKGKLISIKGWTENSKITIEDFIESMKNIGVTNFIFTDINKDGTLEHPNLKIINKIKKMIPKGLTIAGGISDIQDIIELDKLGIEKVIVGKAIYTNNIDLKQAVSLFQNE
ncbi:MAG TPA: 1-(5-phosphoribosyl)-5-[(5-phosphoribosylamino)methylideneamino]imidazole-4-carboxamide isomerase [Dehalococcoidia bacterium]|jgi:phosphoribosylformimino-5-aminoimidazole carboxamide ribotide isomerase|nr:1-(5-phosphoribosyl)-5-[(5-phosphoribosylamino)methylideneamino]imidazole-4-carboxamide isomerase [Dehalococcoidia bacterium]